jgi:hypothetical protein
LTAVDTEDAIDAYLYQQWLLGAMAGATTQQAFMTACSFAAADMHCLVGVALLQPSEFDIFSVDWRDDDVIFQSGFEAGEATD